MQEAIATDSKVNEGCLNTRFEIDDLSLVDVANVIVLTGTLDVELFKRAVFNDGDAALFRLRHVDEHFFFHVGTFIGRVQGRRWNRSAWCLSFWTFLELVSS